MRLARHMGRRLPTSLTLQFPSWLLHAAVHTSSGHGVGDFAKFDIPGRASNQARSHCQNSAGRRRYRARCRADHGGYSNVSRHACTLTQVGRTMQTASDTDNERTTLFTQTQQRLTNTRRLAHAGQALRSAMCRLAVIQ